MPPPRITNLVVSPNVTGNGVFSPLCVALVEYVPANLIEVVPIGTLITYELVFELNSGVIVPVDGLNDNNKFSSDTSLLILIL